MAICRRASTGLLLAVALASISGHASEGRGHHDHEDHDRHGRRTLCTGTLSGSYGSVVVPAGQSCSLSGATVRGDVHVRARGILVVDPGTKIRGDIKAGHCRSVTLNGPVEVRGDVHIERCNADSGYTGPGVEIGGSFVCHDNAARCHAEGGRVGGDVKIFDNTSAAPSEVSLNTIGGDLKCDDNSPAPGHALGANAIGGRALKQCAQGFRLVKARATRELVGPQGGTVGAGGTQLVVPPGALAGASLVTLRSVALPELQVALQSARFDGQKLSFVGAAEIGSSAGAFAAPVSLSIPNSGNLPAGTQVLVAEVVEDITGDGIADLVLVDDAVVTAERITDANPLLPGVRAPGTYAFVAVKPGARYAYVKGSVAGPTGAPAANAPVWNGSAPDFVALTNGLGEFAAPVLESVESSLFVAANSALSLHGFSIVPNPGAGPVPHIIVTPSPIARICEAIARAQCGQEGTFGEQALNKISEALKAPIKNILEGQPPFGVRLTLNPASPIAFGQTTIATVELAEFVAAKPLGQVQVEFDTPIRQTVSFCSYTIELRAVRKMENARPVAAQVHVTAMPAGIVQVGEPSSTLPPRVPVTAGNTPGPATLGGFVQSIKLGAQVEVEARLGSDGTVCAPRRGEVPGITAEFSGENIVIAPTQLTVGGATGAVTINFDGVDTSAGYATGPAVNQYLAQFGVSTPSSPTVLDTSFYANYIRSPTKNIITGGVGRDPTVLVFNFDRPVEDFSFVRAGVVGANSPSGTVAGPWNAAAYDTDGNLIGAVAESQTAFYGDRPAASFSIPGRNIARVQFQGWDFGFAGINIPHITNLAFTRAP